MAQLYFCTIEFLGVRLPVRDLRSSLLHCLRMVWYLFSRFNQNKGRCVVMTKVFQSLRAMFELTQECTR